MDDGGPYVSFDPPNRDFWASRTGLAALPDNQLDQAYRRAYSCILYAKERLITEHGWEEEPAVGDGELLFRLIPADEPMGRRRFCLPKTMNSFLDLVDFWTSQFRSGVFDAKCPAGQDNDLYMSGPVALSDIFYLLQSIAPGMLVIVRVDKFGDTGEQECIRALPRPEWVANHHQLLEHVLGSIDTYQALLDASRDNGKAFKVSRISQQDHTLAVPSALATAHAIGSLEIVQYPEGIIRPEPELNAGAANGKFRYDRGFLMQFLEVCKARPEMLPRLPCITLEPKAQDGSGHKPRNSRSHTPPPPSVPGGRRASGGIGIENINSPSGSKGRSPSVSSFVVSQEPFSASQMSSSASVGGSAGGVAFQSHPMPRVRAASHTGSGTPPHSSIFGRTCSQRDGKGRHSNKVDSVPPGQDRKTSFGVNYGMSHDTVESLEPSQNQRLIHNDWRNALAQDPDWPEVTERRVKGLLNTLTTENFDSISDQIVDWVNKSEKERDRRTLIQVSGLVLENATDEAARSETYARLCRKMMEQISQNVQDDGAGNTDGKPIAGGQLFRKYLLDRCQADFERGWSVKEASATGAERKAADDKASRDAADEADASGKDTGEEVRYFDEYYAAHKAKRQGLGLVKFMGELFKFQMLSERIMHECIKKLIGNVENPEEEEIASLCKLLSTIGQLLDTAKARSHMDVYFQRMKELTKSSNITSRMRHLLLDVLELRERKWVTRTTQAAPTIAAVLEQAAKGQAKAQKDQSVRL